MSLLNKIMNHACSPLKPLSGMFSKSPCRTKLSILIIPAEDILREILYCDTGIFLKLLLGEVTEISSDAIETDTVKNKSVDFRIFARKFLQDFNLILLNLRIRRVHHAVVVRLDFRNRNKLSIVITDRLPCGLIHIDNSTVEIIMSSSEDIKGTEHPHIELLSILDEIRKHVVVSLSGDTFPIPHIWSDFAVIKHLTHNGLYIHHNIIEAQILTFLHIVQNGIRMRKHRIIRLTIEPHVVVVILLFSRAGH